MHFILLVIVSHIVVGVFPARRYVVPSLSDVLVLVVEIRKWLRGISVDFIPPTIASICRWNARR